MSDYIAIKDFKHKQIYTQMIEKKLFAYLSDMIYKPMFKMLKLKPKALNDISVIKQALDNGTLIYKDGVFMSSTRKFSNVLSKELIRLGARYSRVLKGYVLEVLPTELLDYIKKLNTRAKIRLDQVNSFIEDLQLNLNSIIESMVFDEDVITILEDTGKQIQKNVQHLHIIEPELSEEQKEEIARTYTNNMQYYIKNWTESRIIDMRTQVKQAILDGYREEQVVKMLKTEYGIGQRKAKFLAQNETSIVLAQVKKAMYTEMGFEEFVWDTIIDGRERESHKKLNGQIFRFDEPPIIDERTGERGLPGETYNCRCSLRPIRRNSPFVNKEQLARSLQLSDYYKKIEKQHEMQFKDSLVKQKVYHGSTSDFEEFQDQSSYFFSNSKTVADTYRKSPKGGKVHEAYLDIKNPAYVNAEGAFFNKIKGKKTDELVDFYKKQGYDSLIIQDVIDVGGMSKDKKAYEPHTDYIVFDKKQIRKVR